MIEEARRAGKIILEGGVILYPTDTIWGIGCDATNPYAVQRVYQLKQRSDSKSMLVLMNGLSMLTGFLDHIPESAMDIINSATKPTTIIYPDARNFAPNLLAEDGSIGIRITSDPFCQQLIKLTGKPIVSTSANISGEPSPTSFREVDEIVREKVDHVVAWRQKEMTPTVPSTIFKLDTHGRITIIRP